MRVLIARHGESEWNRLGRIQGHQDSGLTSIGAAQAESLADIWRSENIDEVICSPLARARDTAIIVSQSLQSNWRVDDFFIEQSLGEFEGLYLNDARLIHPDIDHIFQNQTDMYNFKGETIQQAGQRVLTRLKMLSIDSNRTIGVITHGNCLQGMVWLLSGSSSEDTGEFYHFNCSFTELCIDQSNIQLKRWAVATHLLRWM
jgi:2,3-bisphosphoglycerate-dependent phosphoglycerate mutase